MKSAVDILEVGSAVRPSTPAMSLTPDDFTKSGEHDRPKLDHFDQSAVPLAALQAIISQQHEKLQVFIEERMKRQATFLDTLWYSHREEMRNISWDSRPVTAAQYQTPPVKGNGGTSIVASMRGPADFDRGSFLTSDRLRPEQEIWKQSSPSSDKNCDCVPPLNTAFDIGELVVKQINPPIGQLKFTSPPVSPPVEPVCLPLDDIAHVPHTDALELQGSKPDRSTSLTSTHIWAVPDSKPKRSTGRKSTYVLPGSKRNFKTSYLIPSTSNPSMEEGNVGAALPIDHPLFVGAIYIAILGNALQMGLEVDLNGGAWDTVWQVMEHIFTFVFSAEMVIKIYYLRVSYFFDRWCLLDCFIACSSVLDSWLIPLITGGGGGDIMRLFRLLRLLRMVKVLRMRRDLMVLVAGIIASLKCMFWVTLLLGLAIYSSAILCVEIVGAESLVDDYKEEGCDIKSFFGTLPKAMLTMFSITIMDTWSQVIVPISGVQPYMVPFFLVFLLMTSFALMNSIIGIIVEQTSAATLRAAEVDEEVKRQEKLKCVEDLMDIVAQIDQDFDGMISTDEMAKVEDNADFQRILQTIDLPPGVGVLDMHMILDDRGTGTLTQEAFLEGMFNLIFCNEFQRNFLSQMSVAQLRRGVIEMRHDLLEQMGTLREHVSSVQQCIARSVLV